LRWYESQICFFDEFVIPLVHKIQESTILRRAGFQGVELAKRNQSEWVSEGQGIVDEMLSFCQEKYQYLDDIQQLVKTASQSNVSLCNKTPADDGGTMSQEPPGPEYVLFDW
jgi:hypothetical protein